MNFKRKKQKRTRRENRRLRYAWKHLFERGGFYLFEARLDDRSIEQAKQKYLELAARSGVHSHL